MKKAIKRIAEKSNRKLSQVFDGVEVNLMLPIAEVMMATQWQIEQLAGAAGLKIIEHIIADDVRRLGPESSDTAGTILRAGSGDIRQDGLRSPDERSLSRNRACEVNRPAAS